VGDHDLTGRSTMAAEPKKREMDDKERAALLAEDGAHVS
jgi:hypothetical protein